MKTEGDGCISIRGEPVNIRETYVRRSRRGEKTRKCAAGGSADVDVDGSDFLPVDV